MEFNDFNEIQWKSLDFSYFARGNRKAVEMDKEFLLFYTPDGYYSILHEKHRIQLNFMIFV